MLGVELLDEVERVALCWSRVKLLADLKCKIGSAPSRTWGCLGNWLVSNHCPKPEGHLSNHHRDQAKQRRPASLHSRCPAHSTETQLPTLGWPIKILPVFIWYTDCGWLTLSPCMLRMTHNSSACSAMQGKKSLTSMPDCPRGRNGLMGASSGLDATLHRVITSPKLAGIRLAS